MLTVGRKIYSVEIQKSGEKVPDSGKIYLDGYVVYIQNARLGEIVDVEITSIHSSKNVAFAKVINYRKTQGPIDFNRKFNCPKEVNSVAFGGGNRAKCVSVIYPDEWKNRRPIERSKKHPKKLQRTLIRPL